ncbi:hypothetical protein N0V91_009058 [Didymella pomorum]|uniref:Uncharacterized protein n=1 Tax=Didymella pomorum TaxID=749634 RepID=A0A9W9D4V9_9PLEO|nr:hypothetical protein N0V91_009058 [Didymella pomorum]
MAARYGPIDTASAAPVASIKRPAIGAPKRYPGVQKKTISAIEAAAERGATAATAVGRPTKKLPLAHPLTRANTNSGGKDVLTGHIASILIELTRQVIIMVLKAPILSQVHPPKIRPTAVAAPNPPTSPAPVDAGKPIELANSGKKNGGTKSAKTPTAPAMVKATKGTLFNSDHSNLESVPVVARSFNASAHDAEDAERPFESKPIDERLSSERQHRCTYTAPSLNKSIGKSDSGTEPLQGQAIRCGVQKSGADSNKHACDTE